MGILRKFGKFIVDKAQEELNKPEDDDPQQSGKPSTPSHSGYTGAPSFPSAQPYGNLAHNDLPNQFSNLNIGGVSGASSPGYAYSNNSSYGNTAFSPPPPSLPSVLTPGNSADLRYGGQPSTNVDYLPPLKNPVPRPPQLSNIPIPEPWDPYQRYYGNTPQGDNLMPPMGGPPPAASPGYPYAYSGPQSAASSPGPVMPSPAAPGYGRASSQPPPSSSSQNVSGDNTTQCSGVTKKNTRCTRKVKSPPALGWINPEDEIPRYCHQHSKELLNVTGFYGVKGWVEFDDWVPKYLNPDTQTILRAEMEKPISTADVPGYIYCYELRDTEHEEVVHLKVGRAVNLVKRIDEWTKTCESKEPILRGWYPGPDTEEAGRVSMMKGVVTAGRKGANCHRLERLIHLELADLVINKPYLNDDFAKLQVKGTGAAPSQKPSASSSKKNDTPTSTPKKKTRAAAASSAKKKKAKAAADDDDDDAVDDDDDDNFDNDDDDSSGSNGSNGSGGSGGKKTRTKGPRMAVRKPCKDCGQVHKEIFTFLRPTSGAYKNKEWERIVQPVLDRWGTYIDYHT